MRLLDRLKRARRDVGRQGVPVGAPQLSRVPPPRRICQKVDRFSFEAKESGLKWELRRLTSPDERVRLEDNPVVLDYGKRRSPSGFRDAMSYIRDLGNGVMRKAPSRATCNGSIWPRPTTVKVLASQADGAGENKPWENDWCDVTDDPSCALTEAGYLQVYYGGKDAQRLQMAARARLPTSLVLRYHKRSLINFVSLTPSFRSKYLFFKICIFCDKSSLFS